MEQMKKHRGFKIKIDEKSVMLQYKETIVRRKKFDTQDSDNETLAENFRIKTGMGAFTGSERDRGGIDCRSFLAAR